jgi:2-polyprenyl-3-methyl-5-hydroxy-6-metoxy-1,4-benzoquinol methylase
MVTAVAAGSDSADAVVVAAVPLRVHVLDVACGTGSLARRLAAKRGARVTAIDRSAQRIEIARSYAAATLGIEYRVADLLALAPRGFDVCVCVDALSEWPLAEAAARMAAAVVPGGQVVIADRAPSWFMGPLRRDLRDALPGIIVRRHLRGRFTAIWTRQRA